MQRPICIWQPSLCYLLLIKQRDRWLQSAESLAEAAKSKDPLQRVVSTRTSLPSLWRQSIQIIGHGHGKGALIMQHSANRETCTCWCLAQPVISMTIICMMTLSKQSDDSLLGCPVYNLEALPIGCCCLNLWPSISLGYLSPKSTLQKTLDVRPSLLCLNDYQYLSLVCKSFSCYAKFYCFCAYEYCTNAMRTQGCLPLRHQDDLIR